MRSQIHIPRPAARWLPPTAAAASVGVGLVNIGSTLTPDDGWRGRLVANAVGHEVPTAAHALALPAGVALVLLGLYLAKRRRRAWATALLVLAAAGALNLLKGLDVEEALASWTLAGMLALGRGAFPVRPEAGNQARTAAQLAFVAAAGLVTAALSILTGRPGAMTGIAVGAMVVGAWLVFRAPGVPRHLPGETARALARGLVEGHGRDTLSFFKLRADHHYFFDASHRAFVAYRVEARVMVVGGDPVGPPAAVARLLPELLAYAAERDLRVAVVGASDAFAREAESAGLRGWYIGDEAILDTERFSLEGRAVRKIRQSVARVGRAGYVTTIGPVGLLADDELDELEALAERAREGEPERGFSMALDSLRGEHLAASLVLVARDADGIARGFLHFVPCFGRDAMSLSFMRRDKDTPNGLMEFLIVRAVEELGARGVRELSLNFAPFARFLHSPENRRERVLGTLVRLADGAFQIERLYRFNAKFFPRWQPRYLVYQGPLGLPRAGLAAMWAERQLPRPPRREPLPARV